MRLAVLAITAGLSVVGCENAAYYQARNQEYLEKLKPRAAFDLSCKELKYTPLTDPNQVVLQMGVEGCGRKATYVISYTNEWVMNNVTDINGETHVHGDAGAAPQ